MSNNFWIAIAIVAGLSAAVLHASGLTLSPLSFLLIYLAPLPLFVAGLGYGVGDCRSSRRCGGCRDGGRAWHTGRTVFSALSRRGAGHPQPSGIDEPADRSQFRRRRGRGERSRMVPGGSAGALDGCSGRRVSYPCHHCHGSGRRGVPCPAQGFCRRVHDIDNRRNVSGGARGAHRAPRFTVILAPLVGASAWLVFMLANMLLASRLLKRWGKSLRPWAAFSSLTFPPQSAIALAALCAASLLPGFLGVAAAVFAAPLATAFAILGLAVIHFLLRDHAARWPLLAGTYAALMLFSWLVMLPLVAVGLAETGWKLRARKAKGRI